MHARPCAQHVWLKTKPVVGGSRVAAAHGAGPVGAGIGHGRILWGEAAIIAAPGSNPAGTHSRSGGSQPPACHAPGARVAAVGVDRRHRDRAQPAAWMSARPGPRPAVGDAPGRKDRVPWPGRWTRGRIAPASRPRRHRALGADFIRSWARAGPARPRDRRGDRIAAPWLPAPQRRVRAACVRGADLAAARAGKHHRRQSAVRIASTARGRPDRGIGLRRHRHARALGGPRWPGGKGGIDPQHGVRAPGAASAAPKAVPRDRRFCAVCRHDDGIVAGFATRIAQVQTVEGHHRGTRAAAQRHQRAHAGRRRPIGLKPCPAQRCRVDAAMALRRTAHAHRRTPAPVTACTAASAAARGSSRMSSGTGLRSGPARRWPMHESDCAAGLRRKRQRRPSESGAARGSFTRRVGPRHDRVLRWSVHADGACAPFPAGTPEPVWARKRSCSRSGGGLEPSSTHRHAQRSADGGRSAR